MIPVCSTTVSGFAVKKRGWNFPKRSRDYTRGGRPASHPAAAAARRQHDAIGVGGFGRRKLGLEVCSLLLERRKSKLRRLEFLLRGDHRRVTDDVGRDRGDCGPRCRHDSRRRQ